MPLLLTTHQIDTTSTSSPHSTARASESVFSHLPCQQNKGVKFDLSRTNAKSKMCFYDKAYLSGEVGGGGGGGRGGLEGGGGGGGGAVCGAGAGAVVCACVCVRACVCVWFT